MAWRRVRVEAIGSAATITKPTGPAGEGPGGCPRTAGRAADRDNCTVRIVSGIGCEAVASVPATAAMCDPSGPNAHHPPLPASCPI
jgi:hypothetical protein